MDLKMERALVIFEQFQDISRGNSDSTVSKRVMRGKKETAYRTF